RDTIKSSRLVVASMEPSRERDGDLTPSGKLELSEKGFNGAVARTRRRLSSAVADGTPALVLHWSRGANATETRGVYSSGHPVERLQWSRRANATETCIWPAALVWAAHGLQWSRRANATETSVADFDRLVEAWLQWSRRAN